MNLRAFVEKLINIQNPGKAASLFLLPLTICSIVYRLAVSARAFLYKKNILSSLSVSCKVISIGNITVGGTGKTPTVCLLAKYFQKKGISVAVINRGYRGSRTKNLLKVSDGRKILASQDAAGDEAFMVAEKLPGVPVIAGKDRMAAAKMAADLYGARVVILDDGFQYLRLKRDADIVLVNSANAFGSGFLLPRGILREPLSALSRASLVLLTKAGISTFKEEEIADRIRQYNPGAGIFKSSFKAMRLRKAKGGEVSFESIKNKRAAGLCSIGDPDSFFSMLSQLKLSFLEKLIFPDHHAYCDKDYRLIKQLSEKSELMITTEKDIVKLDFNKIQTDKLLVLEIEQAIADEKHFFEKVEKLTAVQT
jgi:tetraacyldisaccharide 4'-kinase